MAPGALAQVLRQLPHPTDPNLLVGPETSDDAGVYRLSDELALIKTVDFFPPIVDDPYTFGRIAAANAVSDVYAMGGEPRLALNIACFPAKLPVEILSEIIKGAVERLDAAGVLLVGGHTIEDAEIKFGFAVTGFARPDRIMTNAKARPGDLLVLTKPIGTGVISSALKAGRCSDADAASAIESMIALNKEASAIAVEEGVISCTDVTGFGLAGHLLEMALASNVSAIIESSKVPCFSPALTLVTNKKNRPRSIASVMEYAGGKVERGSGVEEPRWLLQFDPQTSGGLLFSAKPETARKLVEKIKGAVIIGRVVEKSAGWTVRVE
jgi:selenide,water dikinase